MGQQCRTCAHPSRREIERLREGGATLEDLSAEFGLTVSTINRHLNNPKCRARWEAVECAPEPAQAAATVARPMAASSGPVPALVAPMRRRAIAGGPQPVHSVPLSDDPGSPAAAPILPFRAPPVAPVAQPRKSSIPADAIELSLLASFGATDQQLEELVGCGAGVVAGIIGESRGDDRALFSVTHQAWAKHFIRLAMEELIGLRRRRQDALDGKRWREANQFDPKIAKANNDLFLTLQRFGLVGPIPPEELSKRGRDADDIWEMIRGVAQGWIPPELTPEEELRFLEEEQRAIA